MIVRMKERMSGIQIDVTSLTPALQTAYQYLSEGNWRNASDCFDLALKQSPLEPYACLGKAMAASYLKTPDELNYCTGDILENPFFSAALKYAEGDLKDRLTLLVVRLNQERQRVLTQSPAIELSSAWKADGPQDAEPAEAEPGDRTGANWNAADYANPSEGGVPSVSDSDAGAGGTVDVVGGKKKRKTKIIIAVVAAALALIAGSACAVYFYLLPVLKYNKAVDLINEKQFDEGLALFEELGDFSDAPTQYKTGLYVKALYYLANSEFEESQAILEELGDFKDAQELIGTIDARRVTQEIRQIAAAQVGDVVTFGKFETDGNEANGDEDLTWIVLNNRDDLVTLITENSIAAMRYHFNAEPTNWADCSLRTWLNGTFYTSAFELAEADFICKNYITTPTNPDYPSPSGDATVDKVYLLSLNEVLNYFRTMTERKLRCTPASYPMTYTDGNDYCCWWLRTPGARLESAIGVDSTGQVLTVGYDCYQNEQIGVRPVVVVDISAVGGSPAASGSSPVNEFPSVEETPSVSDFPAVGETTAASGGIPIFNETTTAAGETAAGGFPAP